MPMRPGLTVVVIFRDSARTLPRMFDSLVGLDAEVVAVDTGSRDDSIELCRRYGARVFEIPWPDDFAAAKNYGFDQVETEWTLNLDSDEWLYPDSAAAIHRAMANSGAYAYQILRNEVQDDGRHTAMYMLRLWRTDPRMRMSGRVHEHFEESVLKDVGRGRLPIASSITIGHDGLSYGGDLTKIDRNLRYIELELKDRPGQLYYELCKVESLLLLGDKTAIDEARLLTDKLLNVDSTTISDECAMMFANFLTFLADADLEDPRLGGIIRFIHQRLYRYPPALWAAASVELRLGHLHGAYQNLSQLDWLATTDQYQRLNAFNPGILQEDLWAGLADVARALGKKREYESSLAKLKKQFPEDPRIATLLHA